MGFANVLVLLLEVLGLVVISLPRHLASLVSLSIIPHPHGLQFPLCHEMGMLCYLGEGDAGMSFPFCAVCTSLGREEMLIFNLY